MKAQSGLSALLIEDDTHERFAIRRALHDDVQSLLEFETAEAALHRLEQSSAEIDIIISDLKLPGMDGLTLFRTLRQMHCSSPFILLTGNGSEQTAIEAFKAGIDDYLIKASQGRYLDLLSPLVHKVVQHHRLRTRNELLELSLSEANERFQQFMEHYHGIFWLTEYEKPHNLLYVSPNYEVLWDRPIQYLSQNALDWLEAVHPQDRTRVQTAYGQLNMTGQYTETYRIMRLDGSIRWIHDRGLLLKNKSGKPSRIARLVEDVSHHTSISEALQASEERFAQFMAHLPGLAFMKDDHYRITYLNPAFSRIHKQDMNHWMGKTVHELFPHETATRLHANDEWTLSNRQSLETVETVPLEDGLHQYLTVKFPILKKDHAPILGGVSIDITERFKAETQRDQIFSLSLDLMCIIGIDGYFKKINPAFEKLLGYTSDEILSHPLTFFSHPDDQASTQTAFLQMAQAKDVFDFHNRMRDIRGDYLWLEWRATPQLQEQAIYAVARDITQRYHDTKALRRYEQIVSTSSDFLCFLDEQNRFQAVNHGFCEYFNKPLREVTGRHIREFVGQALYDSLLEGRLEDCRNGKVVQFQHKLKFPKGDVRFMEARLNPYVESDGSISGITAMWRDLTEQKRLEQHVMQTQKMESIGTLAGGIAHDFNNILMAILGWAEMGTWKFPKDSPAHKYFQQIGIAGKRGRDLIQQILTFSRQTEHNPRPVDLGPVIEESVKFLRATFPSHIEISVTFKQKMNMVFADPVQIQRIIMNLCSNSEHVLRTTGGTLTIRVDPLIVDTGYSDFPPSLEPGRYIQMAVSDTGPGIPDHILSKIFDPFFTTKPAGEGTGLGLSVVHGIVTNLKGHISVESSPGTGTTFVITIPEYQMLSEEEQESAPLSIATGSGHILFVDDEVSITQIIKEFLQHLGYTVTVRVNAVEALEAFKSHPQQFDCLITDQTMPTLGGDQLAREILIIRPDVPIILCTGFSHTIDVDKALGQGISAFLYKPILLDQLSHTLARVLSHSRSEKS